MASSPEAPNLARDVLLPAFYIGLIVTGAAVGIEFLS